VKRYSHFTTRIRDGGVPANGSARNSDSTAGAPSRRRCAARTTQASRRHVPSDANQRFHSNRGWYGAKMPGAAAKLGDWNWNGEI